MNQNHEQEFKRKKLELVRQAREIYYNADNYRSFFVSAIFLVWHDGEYSTYKGVNVMHDKGGPKCCAEKGAYIGARADGLCKQPDDVVVAVIVVGKPQPDSGSGKKSPTLHPCRECRQMLVAIPAVQDDTIIYTTGPNELDPFEEQRFNQLYSYHEIP